VLTTKRVVFALVSMAVGGAASAQPPAPAASTPPKPFQAGTPLSATNEAGVVQKMSDNVKVYGSFRFAESCTFDAERNLIVAMNAGNPQAMEPNDGFVSLINPDGSVHTSKWVGATRDGLTLNHPLGSAISNGTLYAADGNMVRTFDLATGTPKQAFEAVGAVNLNGIAVAQDGTIYASNTGNVQQNIPQRIYKIAPGGASSIFVDGEPLALPNGVAIDPDGNVVVVNIGKNDVLTFDKAGKLIKTEHAKEAGNDGLVILPDGTKYVSSVRFGSVSRIRPGREAEVIATGIPSAASMCYDSKQNQLVIPMNPHNALAFVRLR
jgi:DNA-binding beta-propeller fold protein YncE